jgi:hypothetical protein
VNFVNALRKNAPTQLRVQLRELVALAHENVPRDALAVTPRRPRSLWLIRPTLQRIPAPLEVPGSTHHSAKTSAPKTFLPTYQSTIARFETRRNNSLIAGH